jgi:hypothetical protein
MPTTWDDRLPNRRPVPCVAVCVAPGDRLLVDVAHVLEGQAPRIEIVRQAVQRDARLDGHPAGGSVVAEHPAVAGQVDQHAVGAGDRRERVAGAHGLDPLLPAGGVFHQLDQLVLGRGTGDAGRRAGLVAPPVGPGGALGERHGRRA